MADKTIVEHGEFATEEWRLFLEKYPPTKIVINFQEQQTVNNGDELILIETVGDQQILFEAAMIRRADGSVEHLAFDATVVDIQPTSGEKSGVNVDNNYTKND